MVFLPFYNGHALASRAVDAQQALNNALDSGEPEQIEAAKIAALNVDLSIAAKNAEAIHAIKAAIQKLQNGT